MALFEINSIPCLLCGITLRERRDKNQKPYFVCNPCGIQLFIRRKAGIDLLEMLKKKMLEQQSLEKTPHILFEIQRLLLEIEGTRKEIKKITSSISIFFPDETLLAERKSLKKRLKTLLKELEILSESTKAKNKK